MKTYTKYFRANFIILAAISSLAFFFCFSLAHAQSCTTLFPSGTAAPGGYGASWNVFSNAKELLLSGSCSGDTVDVTIGSNQPNQYVFNNGFYWNGTQWRQLNLTGANPPTGNWIARQGKASFTKGNQDPAIFVGYVCQFTDNAWKCGCADAACTTPHWQVQALQAGGGGSPSTDPIQEVLPFIMPSRSTLQNSPHKVVAHWHQWAISRDNKDPSSDTYSTGRINDRKALRMRPLPRKPQSGDWKLKDAIADIKWAQAAGVDGFMFNGAGGGNAFTWPEYSIYLKAAQQLNTGFTVAPNLDCTGAGNAATVANTWAGALKDAGSLLHPNRMLYNGKFLFGSFLSFGCSVSYWSTMKSTLQSNGVGASAFMSVTLGGNYNASYNGVADLWSDWGRKNPSGAQSRNYAKEYAGAGNEPIVAAISHGDVRYLSSLTAYESEGSKTLRLNWERAIETGADWAQLVTWNDIGEHAAFYPNTAEQFGFYDLTAYYIAWFKTGHAPTITKDALYYFHRRNIVPSSPPPSRGGSWVNNIEVVAMLTAPATVEIITANGTTRKDVAAGLQVVTAPMPSSGTPRFRIVRNGTAVVDINSAFSINGSTQNDVTYRSGGSMRTEYGKQHSATAACTSTNDPNVCLAQLGEPVWMAK